jgi:hypothetical protein
MNQAITQASALLARLKSTFSGQEMVELNYKDLKSQKPKPVIVNYQTTTPEQAAQLRRDAQKRNPQLYAQKMLERQQREQARQQKVDNSKVLSHVKEAPDLAQSIQQLVNIFDPKAAKAAKLNQITQSIKAAKEGKAMRREGKINSRATSLQRERVYHNMKVNNWQEISPGTWGNLNYPKHTICTNGETFTPKKNGITMHPANRSTLEINDFMKDLAGTLSVATTKF